MCLGRAGPVQLEMLPAKGKRRLDGGEEASFAPELLEANALRMRAICVLLDGPNHPQPSEKGQGASKCTFQVVHCVVSAVKADDLG